jgi:hypothetical protein
MPAWCRVEVWSWSFLNSNSALRFGRKRVCEQLGRRGRCVGVTILIYVSFPSPPGGGAAAARVDAIRGVSGQLCVNQSAPIAALFGAAVAVGAGPGATFLRAESVFAPRQLPFGDTPSSGFDALLTAVEWLESPGPVPHQLMSAFSSTATSQPESSPLMQGNLPLMHFSVKHRIIRVSS